jgi:hypothetical protein
MILNINTYQQTEFESRFKKNLMYQQLVKDFDVIDFRKHWNGYRCGTPRQKVGTRVFSVVPFYYFEYLLSAKSSTIYDIGCGWNVFKKYLPNVIGIGAELPVSGNFYGDVHDFVDDDFVKGHQDFFESVFSICALHFHPMRDLQKIVKDFISMLKPGGIGFLALNAQRMIDRDLDKFGCLSSDDLDRYIRNELGMIDTRWLVFDIDLSVLEEFMNGNIRLVMQKEGGHA